tara:strand:+ start:7383 stop:7868 length:486 start_codon:yes stop_codon:yes gene_type:complete
MASILKGSYIISSTDTTAKAKFDGFLKVSDSKESVITSRPAESGYDYKDAVHNKSRIVNISIVVTETSQSALGIRSYVAISNTLLGVDGYVQEQLDTIEDFQLNRNKVTFSTKYKDYTDYLITNISYDEDENQALIINFSLIETREGSVENPSNVTAGVFS